MTHGDSTSTVDESDANTNMGPLDPGLIPDYWDVYTDLEATGNENAVELRYNRDYHDPVATILILTPEMSRGHDSRPVVEVQDEHAGGAAMGYVNPQAVYEVHDTIDDAVAHVHDLAVEYPLPATRTVEDQDPVGWDDHPLDPETIPDRWEITRDPNSSDPRVVELRYGERPPLATISLATPDGDAPTTEGFTLRVDDTNGEQTPNPGFSNPMVDSYQTDRLTDAVDRLEELAVAYPLPETREQHTNDTDETDSGAPEEQEQEPESTLPTGYAAAYHDDPNQRVVVETDHPEEIQHTVNGIRTCIDMMESMHEGGPLPEHLGDQVEDMELMAAKLSQAGDGATPLDDPASEITDTQLQTAYFVLETVRESLRGEDDTAAEAINDAHYQIQLYEESRL